MLYGLWQHFWLTLRLNFRSGRAIAYGYIMPVLFLFGFGSVFRAGEPPLLAQMGQILTITLLGSACLGMPTALVAERERGVWRRYQLLPAPIHLLLVNVLLVRLVIVTGSVLLQLALANWIYRTPLPEYPMQFVGAFFLVMFAFLGLGVIVAALAPDVPAVQALGQCLFLPMILIGGVGVPLVALPAWAQKVASFMPGRYAVEALQSCFEGSAGLREVPFALLALLLIGLAAGVAGFRLLRWEEGTRIGRCSAAWLGGAVAGWVAVGVAAIALDRVEPVAFAGGENFRDVSEAQIAAIEYQGLPPDDGIYTPIGSPLESQRLTHRMQEFLPRLEAWEPGRLADVGQSVRHLLSIASIADITQDTAERVIARAVYELLRERFEDEELSRALAWVVLEPEAGRVATAAPELGLRGEADASIIRERSAWYARKFLGRVRGMIAEP